MNSNAVIIHGSFGSPFENWFQWLYKELTNKGIDTIVPQFPIGVDKQNYTNWSALLDCYFNLGYINENTILIGHSIAPAFISKYLIEKKQPASKLIFVSGFNNYLGINEEFDTVNKTFFFDNIEEIHKYCKDITCLYSSNDPYLPLNVLEEFADKVADKSKVIENGGHLSKLYPEFPEILKYID